MVPPGKIAKIGGLFLVMAIAAANVKAHSSFDQPGGTATGVFINQRELTPAERWELERTYPNRTPRGHFWYDSASGLWGVWGHEAAGYIRPGHNFGPLPANASRGNTGVFLNGRELNLAELLFLQVLFDGQVRPGRIWLDGSTWNMGNEGSRYPLANLRVALVRLQLLYAQTSGQYSQGKAWSWRDGSGTGMASDGNCAMIAVPGAPVYSNGC